MHRKFGDAGKGILSGFDRIVFKGTILPLVYGEGAMRIRRLKGGRNKDFKRRAMSQTALVVDSAQACALCGFHNG